MVSGCVKREALDGAASRDVIAARVNGKLYMQRVTPKGGLPYVLMDMQGDGTFTKQDDTLTPNLRVPQWVLFRF